jgi:hypothetical protein
VFNPTSVLLSAVNAGCSETSETFTVSEVGYSGTFSAVSENTSIATVTQVSPGVFVVTSTDTTNGPPGTTIKVSDTAGRSANEPVNMSICLP